MVINIINLLYNFQTRLNIYDKKYLAYLFKNNKIIEKFDLFLDNIFINDKLHFYDIPKIVLFVSNICIDYNYNNGNKLLYLY